MQRKDYETNQEPANEAATWDLKWCIAFLAVLCVLLAIGLGYAAKSQNDARAQDEQQRVALVQKQKVAAAKAAKIQAKIDAAKAKSFAAKAKIFQDKRKGKKMATYSVSGAGDSEWDGIYAETGTANGYPAYSLDSSHWLSLGIIGDPLDGNLAWQLSASAGDDDTVSAYNGSTDVSAPSGAMVVSSSSSNPGSLPAPTVSATGVSAIIKPTAFKAGATVTIASSAPADGDTDEVYAAADTGLTTSLATVTLTEVTPTLDTYQYTFVAPSLSPGDYVLNHVMTLTQIPLDFRIYVARRKNRILN